MYYARPNPAYNSRRGGLLTSRRSGSDERVNLPPDNQNPEKAHVYDHTCLCETCRAHEYQIHESIKQSKKGLER